MTDNTCVKELNRQLQALQSRVKSLEDNMAASIECQIQDMISTIQAIASMVTAGGPAAALVKLANQYVLALIGSSLPPGHQGADAWRDILDLASGISVDFKQIFAQMLMENLQIPPFSAGMISGLLAQYQALLAQLIEEGAPQEEIDAVQDIIDSLTNAYQGQNRLTECLTQSSLIGEG